MLIFTQFQTTVGYILLEMSSVWELGIIPSGGEHYSLSKQIRQVDF